MFWESLLFVLSKVVFFCSSIRSGTSFPKPLPPEEEKKNLAAARAGDSAAREKLIEHNLRLVAHVAKKYAGAAEADDLLSVGSIGLIKAINTYEPNKGTQLATYTAKCIENEILMLLRANKKFKNNVSLSEVVGTDKDGNELMLIDLLCEKDDSVFQKVEKAIQNEKFTELVRAVLTEREFKIITLRYGL